MLAVAELVVVVGRDDVDQRPLAGHAGRSGYVRSPPQPARGTRSALVAVLLGCPAAIAPERQDWTQAIAGGPRTIAIPPRPPPRRAPRRVRPIVTRR